MALYFYLPIMTTYCEVCFLKLACLMSDHTWYHHYDCDTDTHHTITTTIIIIIVI